MRLWLLAAIVVVLAVVLATSDDVGNFVERIVARRQGGYSVSDRLQQYGAVVEARVKKDFAKASLDWPPVEISYLAFKDARVLDVYGRDSAEEAWTFVRRYPIRRASGEAGPKLREGDGQVPEGIYRAESLNPNSLYHLSVRVNYPNAFDRLMAAGDGRSALGGDIMIHGGAVSIGCLAMGNEAAEDLFVIAALAGVDKVRILIAPTDLRRGTGFEVSATPAWLEKLYADLRAELSKYPQGASET